MASKSKKAEVGPPPELSPKHVQAILLLVAGKTKAETAAAVGVGPGTISDWVKIPAFIAYKSQIMADIVESVKAGLVAMGPRALSALGDVLDGTVTKQDEDGNPYEVKADPQHRLAAAKTILDRIGASEVKGVELTGKDGGPVRAVLVDELGAASDDALRSMVAAASVVTEPKP